MLFKLQAAGWSLNADKCQFTKKSIFFLGHVIFKKTLILIKPDIKKILALSRIPSSRNVTELKRLLEKAGILNKSIPNFANVVKLFNELLKNNVEWILGRSQVTAFEEIKQRPMSDSRINLI